MIRYFLAALLLRLVDAGATVGLVLVCTARTDIDDPIRTAGLLGAALTAPHLLGPLSARWVDRARDPRWVIAAAGTTYAVLLAGRRPPPRPHHRFPWSRALVVAAGLCGPILTGGLSSRLPELRVATVGRRRSSLDGLTYGLAGSLGPATVSVFAPLLGPLTAILVLISGAVLGAALTIRIPIEPANERAPLRLAGAPGDGPARSGRTDRCGGSHCSPGSRRWWCRRPCCSGIARGQQLSPGHGGWVVAAFGLRRPRRRPAPGGSAAEDVGPTGAWPGPQPRSPR